MSRRVFVVVVALLVALASFAIRAGQLPISSCELLTAAFTHSDNVLTARLVSVLFFALTLAFTYRLAAEMFDRRLAMISVVLVGLTEGTVIFFGAATEQSWLSLLAVVSTWLINPHPKSLSGAKGQRRARDFKPGVGSLRPEGEGLGMRVSAGLYVICAAIMVASSRVMLIVIVFQLLYLLIVVNKLAFRAILFAAFMVAAVTLKRLVDLQVIGGEAFAVPPILVAAWILGVVAVAVAVVDGRQKGALSTRPYRLIVLWLTIPVAAGVALHVWNTEVLIVPVLIALVYALSIMTLRTRVVLAAVFAILLIAPIPTISNSGLVKDVSAKPDAQVIVDRVETCVGQDDVITQLYRSQMPFYVHGSAGWLSVTDTREVTLEDALPDSVINAEGQWRIGAVGTKDTVTDRTLIFQKEYGGVRAALYLRQPVENVLINTPPIYRVGSLALLKFTVQPGNSVSAGSTLIVNSWWSAPQPAPDNYIVKIDLVGTGQNAIATDSGLLGKSYTQDWTRNSVHNDQRVLNVPQNAAPGDYNLIISLHGSSNVTNLHFDSGDYAYLTTVTIAN